MGGDFAPGEIVKGAVMGAKEYGVGIVLVGPEEMMRAELAKHDCSALDIEVVHTDEYLIEGEPPAYALREKRNASIIVATKLVKQGKADAVLGAGPTGGNLLLHGITRDCGLPRGGRDTLSSWFAPKKYKNF